MTFPTRITTYATRRILAGILASAIVSACATRPHRETATEPFHASIPGEAATWPPLDPPAQPDKAVDFETALRRALEVSPTLKVLDAGLRTARLTTRAVGDIKNPELRASIENRSGSIIDMDESDSRMERASTTSDQTSLAVRLFPPNPFTRGPEKETAQFRADAAALRVEQEEILIADRLRSAWLSIGFIEADLARIREHMLLLEQSVDRMVSLTEEGAATLLDIANAEQLAIRALLDRQDTETALHEALSEVAALLHYDIRSMSLTGTEWISSPALEAEKLDEKTVGRLVVEHAVELAILDREVASARAAYTAARRAWIPWIRHIEAEYTESEGERRTDTVGNRGRRTSSDDGWEISMAVEIPLFSAFHTSPDLIKSQWENLELQAVLDHENKKLEALSIVEQIRRSSTNLKDFDRRAEPAAERLRNLVEQLDDPANHRPGEQIRAVSHLLSLERLRLRLEYRLRRDMLQLETLTGSEISSLMRE